MSNALHQMNISYEANEDRLLLKVTTDNAAEYRIWLTRRYTILLTQVLQDQINQVGGTLELASRRDTLDLLKGGAFEQEYESNKAHSFPLGESGVLGFRINVKREPGGDLNLQLLPEEGEGINFALNKSTMFLLYNLLEQALGGTDWNIVIEDTVHQSVH